MLEFVLLLQQCHHAIHSHVHQTKMKSQIINEIEILFILVKWSPGFTNIHWHCAVHIRMGSILWCICIHSMSLESNGCQKPHLSYCGICGVLNQYSNLNLFDLINFRPPRTDVFWLARHVCRGTLLTLCVFVCLQSLLRAVDSSAGKFHAGWWNASFVSCYVSKEACIKTWMIAIYVQSTCNYAWYARMWLCSAARNYSGWHRICIMSSSPSVHHLSVVG